jgi:hypothetical protein
MIGYARIALLGLTSVVGFAGCAQEMSVEPQKASPTSLQGKWDYVATDGADLSDYGITYAFQDGIWTYQLSDAGTKQYALTTAGNAFTAVLRNSTFQNGEAAGSRVEGTYRISGDTLVMNYEGHTAMLLRSPE